MHTKGFVCREIERAKVYLDRKDNCVKLSYFEKVNDLILMQNNGDNMGKEITSEKIIKNYIKNISPELSNNLKNAIFNYKLDIWALGCLLFELKFNKMPFISGESLKTLKNGFSEKGENVENFTFILQNYCFKVNNLDNYF